MTELQKMALNEAFSYGGTRLVLAVHNPEYKKDEVSSIIKENVEKFTKAFGIDPDSLSQNVIEWWITPVLETRGFSDIGERNAFIRRHYCEAQMYDLRPTQLDSDDKLFFKQAEDELRSIDRYRRSEYQKCGNEILEYWEIKLEPYLFGIDIGTDYKNYISSFFSNATRRGMWITEIKARALVQAIHRIYSKMRIIEVSPVPLEF